MPRKYWLYLPEAALIPVLVACAQSREAAMIATPPKPSARQVSAAAAWSALREEAMGCTRCPLYRDTTQTVFGEGPVDAPLMFIGEQPGDQEDQIGRAHV